MKNREPWLRGTLTDLPAIHRAVLHALQLAEEDLTRWCAELSFEEMNASAGGIPPVAFHLKHISRSIDRLLTYAEGHALSESQMAALHNEQDRKASPEGLFIELRKSMESASARIRGLADCSLETSRTVGRSSLPTTLGGLLVHVADHTQRHVGQAITTAKIIRATHRA
jgi:uncharacterized damage-inducible protein DinB